MSSRQHSTRNSWRVVLLLLVLAVVSAPFLFVVDALKGSGQLGGLSVDGAFTAFVNGPLRREAAVGPAVWL
jgi:hypothetical protein